MKMVMLSAIRTGRLYPPRKIPGTHFCQRLSRPQGHNEVEKIKSMKNLKEPIGIWSRVLPTCNTVPKPAALLRAIALIVFHYIISLSVFPRHHKLLYRHSQAVRVAGQHYLRFFTGDNAYSTVCNNGIQECTSKIGGSGRACPLTSQGRRVHFINCKLLQTRIKTLTPSHLAFHCRLPRHRFASSQRLQFSNKNLWRYTAIASILSPFPRLWFFF
jgi:hypothetical protein